MPPPMGAPVDKFRLSAARNGHWQALAGWRVGPGTSTAAPNRHAGSPDDTRGAGRSQPLAGGATGVDDPRCGQYVDTSSNRSLVPSPSSTLFQSVEPEPCRADFTVVGLAPGLAAR